MGKCPSCVLFSEEKNERKEKHLCEKRASWLGEVDLRLMAFRTHKGQHSAACGLMGTGMVTACLWRVGGVRYKEAICFCGLLGDSICEAAVKAALMVTRRCC